MIQQILHDFVTQYPRVEKFESKAAMQRRIKDLEQDEHIIFENRI